MHLHHIELDISVLLSAYEIVCRVSAQVQVWMETQERPDASFMQIFEYLHKCGAAANPDQVE